MSQAQNQTTVGEGIWFDKVKYDEAERKYYERLIQKGNLISAEEKKVDNIHHEEEKSIDEMSPMEQHQESIWLDKFKYDTAEIKYYEENAKKTHNEEENLNDIKSPFCGKVVGKRADDQEINSGVTLTDNKDDISRKPDDCTEGKGVLCASSELDKLVTSIVEESDEEFLKLEKLKELNLIDFTKESLLTKGKGTVKDVDPKLGQEVFDTQITENQPNKNICLVANREDVTKSQMSSTDKERNSQAYKMSSSIGVKPVEISSKNVLPGEICSLKKVKAEEICSPKNVKSEEICFPKKVQPVENRPLKNVNPEEICFLKKEQPGEICSPKKVMPMEICSTKNVKTVDICLPKNLKPKEIGSSKNVRSEDINPMSQTTKNGKVTQLSPENFPTRSNKSPKFTHEKVKIENPKILMPKNEIQKDNIRQENSKLPKGYHHSHNSTNDPSSRDKETNVNTIPELEKPRHHHQSKMSAISDENNPSIKPIQPVSNQNVQVIIQNDKQTEVNSDDPQFKPKDARKKKRTKKDRIRDRKGFTTEGTKNGGWNSLAGEVAKARQHIKTSLQCIDDIAVTSNNVSAEMTSRLNSLEKENNDLKKQVTDLNQLLKKLEVRVGSLERTVSAAQSSGGGQQKGASGPAKPQQRQPPPPNDEEDDGVDLFGSDSEEEDEETAKVKEQRLAEYAARKSKKPTLIAKSNIILDVKPWDDETDMKQMEQEVRKISIDGLIWGASKLVPLAYGIHKLQISCVVEDEKVSIDWLTDTIMENEDYVQSVDIAAFNKV